MEVVYFFFKFIAGGVVWKRVCCMGICSRRSKEEKAWKKKALVIIRAGRKKRGKRRVC
jgi:hypothetical protein